MSDTRFLRLSCAARYALLGLIELAAPSREEFRQVREIARRRGLPPDFLAKVFQQLSHRGLLASRRGVGGGYALTRPPESISLAEVLESVEPHDERGRCFLELKRCDGSSPCALHPAVAEAEALLLKAMQATRLSDITAGDFEPAKERPDPS